MLIDTKDALSADLTESFEKHTEQAARLLLDLHKNPLPLFALPAMRDDISAMQDMAANIMENAKRVIILGTGGSTLGAQALAQITGWHTLAAHKVKPELVFADNLDADSLTVLLTRDYLVDTKFLVVSKSGGTAETLMQLCCVLTALTQADIDIKTTLFGITGRADNVLRRIAEKAGFSLLEHAENIGGRFSVLTNTGLLPALLVGLDPIEIRSGAAQALDPILSGKLDENTPLAVNAALHLAHAQAGRNIAVLIAYGDRLERLTHWQRQLWAESLGKQGKGTTPANALGPIDQHSQLQLYLDGPDDKFYTFLSAPSIGKGAVAASPYCDMDELAWLQNRPLGDLVEAERRGTMNALINNARPVRHIALADISARSFGELLMFMMLETIITGGLLGVDVFNQPAVEQGKIIARQLMAETNI